MIKTAASSNLVLKVVASLVSLGVQRAQRVCTLRQFYNTNSLYTSIKSLHRVNTMCVCLVFLTHNQYSTFYSQAADIVALKAAKGRSKGSLIVQVI